MNNQGSIVGTWQGISLLTDEATTTMLNVDGEFQFSAEITRYRSQSIRHVRLFGYLDISDNYLLFNFNHGQASQYVIDSPDITYKLRPLNHHEISETMRITSGPIRYQMVNGRFSVTVPSIIGGMNWVDERAK
ncbi:MAG: hypothetical protein ABJZ55_05065 [Fuerstiella sp.]